MKTPTLAICLIALLARPIIALEPTPSPNPSAKEYGIDPGTLYPGTLVTELLRGAEDEAAAAATDAYAEGYKAGRVDAAALWKPQYEAAVERSERAWKSVRMSNVFTLLAGVLTGFGLNLAASAVAR